jgi:hypothetical protein
MHDRVRAASTHEPDGATPLVPVMRRLLYVAAGLVFLAGVPLFVFPEHTDRYFAWTIDSRMTAVFLGAAYWSAIGLELAAARAASWRRARIAVPAVFVFTSLTLGASLVHVHKLHLDHDLPLSARVVAWAWLAIYVTVPIVMAIGWIAQHRAPLSPPPPSGLPAAARLTLLALAVLLLAFGAVLLAAPSLAYDAWPWTLTPITRTAIGAWLIGLGVAAGHAWLIDDKPSLRPLGLTGVAFGLLQALALARYGNELDWASLSSVVYVAVLVALTVVSGWALLPVRPPRLGSDRAVIDTREQERELEAAGAGTGSPDRPARTTTRSNA